MELKDSQQEQKDYLIETDHFNPIEYHVEINIWDGFEESWEHHKSIEDSEDDPFLTGPDQNSFDEISGQVEILFQIHGEEVNSVKLNILDSKLTANPVVSYCDFEHFPTPGNMLSSIKRIPTKITSTFSYKAETVEIQFSPSIKKKESKYAIITVQYSTNAVLNYSRQGLFRRSYESPTHGLQAAYFTQFEPCNARQAFPCIDQPSSKAYFNLRLNVPSYMQALANTSPLKDELKTVPKKSRNGISEEKITIRSVLFKHTPFMSTYLVGFAVGEFDFVERITQVNVWSEEIQNKSIIGKKEIPIRVWTPKNQAQEGNYAADVAVKAFQYFTDKFKITNPLEKIDFVSIEDLPVLGMENWGMLSFRDEFLLVNEKTPFSRRQRIARLVCHELGHQWFGNLATMSWWKYLWLKEGLARFLEYALIDKFYPEWNFWLNFLKDIYEDTLESDGNSTTHPIEAEVYHPKQIKEIFDLMSYGKGASVMRMVCSFIGEEKTWEGLSTFLHRFQYNKAETSDMWKALHDVTNIDITSVMNDWVAYAGHPIIKVQLEEGENSLNFHIEQILDENSKGALQKLKTKKLNENETNYNIPLSVKQKSKDSVHREVISSSKTIIKLSTDDKSEWVKFNWGHYGFYRVLYPKDMWLKLAKGIEKSEIPLEDLLGLLIDIFSFNSSDVVSLDMETLLTVLLSFKGVTNPSIWEYLIHKYKVLIGMSRGEARKYLLKFTNKLLDVISSKLLWWSNSNSDFNNEYTSELRSKVMDLLLVSLDGPSDIIKQLAMESFNTLISYPASSKLPSHAIYTILSYGVAYSNDAYEKVLSEVLDSSNMNAPEFFVALWHTKNPELIAQNLTLLFEAPIPEGWLDNMDSKLGIVGEIHSMIWKEFMIRFKDAVANKMETPFLKKNIPILSFLMAQFRHTSIEKELFEDFVSDCRALFSIFPYLSNYITNTISIVTKNNDWFERHKGEFESLKL